MAGTVQSLLQEVLRTVKLLYCSGLGCNYSAFFGCFCWIFFVWFLFVSLNLVWFVWSFVCLGGFMFVFVGSFFCCFSYSWKQHLGVTWSEGESTICHLVPIIPWTAESTFPIFHIMPCVISYAILFKLKLDIHNMTNTQHFKS